MSANLPITVAALYRFTPFTDPQQHRQTLTAVCSGLGIRGTLLLAHEGINGTIAGSEAAVRDAVHAIKGLPGCTHLDVKYSAAEAMPFFRLKVLVKREIVTLGVAGLDPSATTGTYVTPSDWNRLIDDPGTVVIDTRNAYETDIGTFRGSVDPSTVSFRDFPDWFRAHRDQLLDGKQRVAMFCTGGIRCEKSTAFLKSEGIDEVYHLQGGILRYLEEVPETESRWDGECFVFDQRVSVGHGLTLGSFGRCHACRRPLSAQDMDSPLYEEGVTCPLCVEDVDDSRRARFAERQKQIQLAAARGEAHVGMTRPGSSNHRPRDN